MHHVTLLLAALPMPYANPGSEFGASSFRSIAQSLLQFLFLVAPEQSSTDRMAPAREESQSAKKGPTPLRSIIAGSTAGAVEIGMVYLFPHSLCGRMMLTVTLMQL